MSTKTKNVAISTKGYELSDENMSSIIREAKFSTIDPIVGETLSMNRPILSEDGDLLGFVFDSTKRPPVRINLSDLKRFTNSKIPITESFRNGEGKPFVARQFTVKGHAEYLNRDKQRVYPLWCYTEYDSIIEARGDDDLISSDFRSIYESEVLSEHVDKYYRAVDIDKSIIYFPQSTPIASTIPKKRKPRRAKATTATK